jgi:hypothetical protein
MKTIAHSFVVLSISLFFLSSCEKALEPVSGSVNEKITYKMNLVSEVVPGVFRDSVKLSFTPDSVTWDQNALSRPYLLLIYRSNGNADKLLIKKQLVGAGGAETYVSYHDSALSLFFDSVLISDNKTAMFAEDSSVGGFLTFFTVAIVTVSHVADTSAYKNGFVGVLSISNTISTGEGLGLSLAGGATETAVNPVRFSAVISKKDVFMVVAHRYSALRPVLSADTILSYSKNNNKDGEIWSGTVLYGYVSKPDTFFIRDINSKLVLDSSNVNELKLLGEITLARGYGRKNVVLQCFNSRGIAVGTLLWDDIALKVSPASIRFDFELANRDSFFVDEIKKQVCVLSKTIPIIFDSYGDTSFLDSNIFIWIATRKAASKFFNKGQFENSDMTYSSKGTKNWGDCIFETKPEEFILNSSGKIRERILTGFDFQNGYRISPLASVSTHDAAGWKGTNFGSAVAISKAEVKRSDISPEIISRLVKKGSILGYDSTTLDSFTVSNVCISHPDSLVVVGNALSWFTAIPFSTFHNNTYSSVQQYISTVKKGFTGDVGKIYNSLSLAYSIDYSDNLYQHPFRSIPITSSAVGDGVKEFIVIVMAKGKYFGENRVYFSSSTFNYSLVWDKIPPQIKWSVNPKVNSPYYSPLQASQYAPFCYMSLQNPATNKCTDFSQFKSGVFDVYLSTKPPLERACSIRDGGFGKIRSVKLMFNYSSEFIGSDPLTGVRKYLAPDIVMELSSDLIATQKKETYFSQNKVDGSSYALSDVAFRNIDFSGWRAGMWDMWIQTEDDLGNSGLAPYSDVLNSELGEVSVRQIEIK